MLPDRVAIRLEARAHPSNDPANPTARFGFRLEFVQDCRGFQGFDAPLPIYACRTTGKYQASELNFWFQRQSGENPPDVGCNSAMAEARAFQTDEQIIGFHAACCSRPFNGGPV